MSIAVVAVFLQTQLNLELVRYTLYSGEPIFTGFMRTRPGPYFWGPIYAFFTWLGAGWPHLAGVAAGALAAGILGRLPNDEQDGGLVLLLGSLLFLLCGIILLAGRKIERTLEGLSWFMVLLGPHLHGDCGCPFRALVSLVGSYPGACPF